MTRTIHGVYRNGKILPLEAIDLPDETPVIIVVEAAASVAQGDRSEQRADPLARIYELAEDLGPPDLASNLDHYLYKSPKQK